LQTGGIRPNGLGDGKPGKGKHSKSSIENCTLQDGFS